MPLNSYLLHAWRRAERAARAAERELHDLTVRSTSSSQAEELRERAAAARHLRTQAHALFEEALRAMERKADMLHHRQARKGHDRTPNKAISEGGKTDL